MISNGHSRRSKNRAEGRNGGRLESPQRADEDWPPITTADRAICPCGALAEEHHRLCRKCRARATWRRRHHCGREARLASRSRALTSNRRHPPAQADRSREVI